MSVELLAVLSLLVLAIVMFAIDRPRMDAVALLMMCALPFTGVIEMSEALAGFSDPNIVLIAALFVIGDGLVRTGVARQTGDWLIRQAGASSKRLTALLMTIVCGLGGTMSSTAVTAIFIPVALRISRTTGIPPGHLLMPMSSAALISGMLTLVGTAPNLVINSELVRRGEAGFHFFSFTPFGVPVLGMCILYMLYARRWLPASNGHLPTNVPRRPTLTEWIERYHLAGREHRLRVSPGSPLIGKRLDESSFRGVTGANIVGIQREKNLLQPTAKTILETGDILFVDFSAATSDVENLREKYQLQSLPLSGAYFTDHLQEIGMAELMIPADSELIGRSVIETEFRSRFGLSVIGLRRGVEAVSEGIREAELQLGDVLLVIGPWKAIRNLQSTTRALLPLGLPAEFEDVAIAPRKSARALGVLLLVVLLMITGVIPNVQAALIGCLLMGLLGCITLDSAYRSIDWKTLVLIVGMLPFSLALQRTGGVEMASEGLMRLLSNAGTYGILATLFTATAMLSLFISNTATAVLMAPVALAMADEMQASPYPFAMIVALAASSAFMTPVSSPVNTLVVTPGGYRFLDFVKVGVPFTLLTMIVCVLLVPWLLPL